MAFNLKHFPNFLANSCGEGSCWCVSNGGNTCLKWNFTDTCHAKGCYKDFRAEQVDCGEDQCWDRDSCRRTDKFNFQAENENYGIQSFRARHGETGYWCDDTYFSENKGG